MGGHPIGAALLLCLLSLGAKVRAAKSVCWLCVSKDVATLKRLEGSTVVCVVQHHR